MSKASMDGVYALLTASQVAGTFYDDVGGRIYQTTGPLNAALPLAVVSIVDDPPDLYFSTDDVSVGFSVDLYGPSDSGPAALMATNDKLFALLHKQSVTVSGYTAGGLFCINRGTVTIDEDAVLISSRWRLWASA